MSGRIILLRHGQTFSNVDHIFDTRPPGAELTNLGRQQASEVGAELAEYLGAGNGHTGRLAGVVSSIALRAQQTALLATAGFERAAGLTPGTVRIDVRSGIHEAFAGDYEGQNDETSHRIYAQVLRRQLERELDAQLPGGETTQNVIDRFRPVLEELRPAIAGDRDVVVVSHGTAIRTIATYATGVDGDFAFAGYLANCRYIVLKPGEADFGQWEMVRWSDLDRQQI